MSDFHPFLRLGLEHLTDIQNYEHVVFIASILIIYPVNQWVKVLLLLSGLIAGDLLGILSAILKIPATSANITALLFPLIILLSGFLNFFQKSDKFMPGIFKFKYVLTVIFAYLHCVSFASYIRGKEEQEWLALISFNIGTELGHILLIIIFMVLSLLPYLLKIKKREWIISFSGIITGISLIQILELLPVILMKFK